MSDHRASLYNTAAHLITDGAKPITASNQGDLMLSKADFSFITSAQTGHRVHHGGDFDACTKGLCPQARKKLAASRVTA